MLVISGQLKIPMRMSGVKFFVFETFWTTNFLFSVGFLKDFRVTGTGFIGDGVSRVRCGRMGSSN